MLLLGRFQGKNGQIDFVECSHDGTRVYFEEGVRQSQATPNGESVFTYIKIMETFLDRSANVLILGCGRRKSRDTPDKTRQACESRRYQSAFVHDRA